MVTLVEQAAVSASVVVPFPDTLVRYPYISVSVLEILVRYLLAAAK